MKVYIGTIVDSYSRLWEEKNRDKMYSTNGYSQVFATKDGAIDFLWNDYLYQLDNFEDKIEEYLGGETREEFAKWLEGDYGYITFEYDYIEYTLWESEL